MHKSLVIALATATAFGLAACGKKEPSNLTFDQAAQELAKGADSFKAYVKGLDNKLVKWTGTVTETRKWHEDDYAPAAGMLVDMDGAPGPELFVNIGVDNLETAKTGAKVSFTARLMEGIDEKGKLLIKMKVEEFH